MNDSWQDDLVMARSVAIAPPPAAAAAAAAVIYGAIPRQERLRNDLWNFVSSVTLNLNSVKETF